MDIAQEIKKFFKGDIAGDEATLTTYSRDASLFEVKPALVVFPKDVDDVKQLVRFTVDAKARGEHISLTPRSGGTDMSGGALTASIVVDCARYLNRIKEVGDGYAIAEPGVFYRDFEKETLKKGFFLPSYPASREICTVGGMTANNSGGEKTLTYGKTEDYVTELKMILRDGNEYIFRPLSIPELEAKKREQTVEGEAYRNLFGLVDMNYDALKAAKPAVSKNSAGYALWDVYDREKGVFDLTKAIVGSQGTFGIITEITFRLVRPKAHSRLLLIFLKDVQPLAEVVERVLRHKPESFESYDDHTFKVAMKFLGDIVRRMGGSFFSLGLSFLPELWMIVSGGVPKLVLLAEFTGDTGEEAEGKARAAEKSLAEFHLKAKVTKSQDEAKKYWVIRRESFNLLRHHLRGLRTAPFIDDFVVRPETLSEFLPKLYGILNRYPIVYTVAGHIGDGNFHIIPLMDFKKPEVKQIIEKLSEEVYGLVVKFKGSITGEHNDGLIRGPFLKMMYGEKVYGLFEEAKRIFDPQGIFNPGKKVGVTLKQALAQLAPS